MDFDLVRRHIIGQKLTIQNRPSIYADWTASGRLYQPIEQFMAGIVGPWVANTHTESSDTGQTMTRLYQQARSDIKLHVNAGADDVLVCTGTGMTGAVNKFQRILGLKSSRTGNSSCRPLVIITHMEHHSNQTSWLSCDVDVVVLNKRDDGLPDLDHLRKVLAENQHRDQLFGSFTACSNVTGIETPIHEMAVLMHEYGGWCFADYAASAPYVAMNMHPEDPTAKLDAVMFSPHKFLGGPGSTGVLIFDRRLYHLDTPDQPGGGTVTWTDPWGGYRFLEDIEAREDGGTPGFLQTIRASLAIRLKDAMGTDQIRDRERLLTRQMMTELNAIDGVHLLEPGVSHRLPIFSFWIAGLHHNLVVRLLNDRYGIQARGGCSCAGTYGHILMGVDKKTSHSITCEIDQGNLAHKPGWIRLSLHPVMTDTDVSEICAAIKAIARHGNQWQQSYQFDPASGEWTLPGRLIPGPDLSMFDPVVECCSDRVTE